MGWSSISNVSPVLSVDANVGSAVSKRAFEAIPMIATERVQKSIDETVW